MTGTPLRPREFCELALSIESRGPRKLRRKRHAHHEIEELKHKLLGLVIEQDPEPDDLGRLLFEAALQEPVDGPARGVVTDILLDWQMVRSSQRTADWMARQANEPVGESPRRRRAWSELAGGSGDRG